MSAADDGKERPKLQLAPRTVAAAPATPAEPRAAAASKPSPFGNAKPVDTAAALKRKEEEVSVVKEQLKTLTQSRDGIAEQLLKESTEKEAL